MSHTADLMYCNFVKHHRYCQFSGVINGGIFFVILWHVLHAIRMVDVCFVLQSDSTKTDLYLRTTSLTDVSYFSLTQWIFATFVLHCIFCEKHIMVKLFKGFLFSVSITLLFAYLKQCIRETDIDV